VVNVEQWAEIRRMRFVEGLAIREIRRRTGASSGNDPEGAAWLHAAELFASVAGIEA
jgi:hypothetical protein